MLSTITKPEEAEVKEDEPKTIIVIPARMESTRLPGKPMLPIRGKPMLHHTYDLAKKTEADHVIVTTPNREIGSYCADKKLTWMPTSNEFPTGTHRVADIVSRLKEDVVVDLVVNIQCDEFELKPDDVNDLLSFARESRDNFDICTIAARTAPWGSFDDPNITKAAVAINNKAYWFSRAPMGGAIYHCGIYVYNPLTLKELGQTPPTMLSRAESLEQLSFIEEGYSIGAWVIDKLPRSLNTKEEYDAIIKEESSLN